VSYTLAPANHSKRNVDFQFLSLLLVLHNIFASTCFIAVAQNAKAVLAYLFAGESMQGCLADRSAMWISFKTQLLGSCKFANPMMRHTWANAIYHSAASAAAAATDQASVQPAR